MRTRGLWAKAFGIAVVAAAAVLVAGAGAAWAGPLAAASAQGQGPFNNDARLLIDGSMPPEGADYADPGCVHWQGTATFFVIDLGREYQVTGITAQVDNNDDYVFEGSADGARYSALVTVPANLGRVSLGMETFSTDPAHPRYLAEARVQAQRARYIKVSARGGDDAHSISEVQVLGEGAGAAPETPAGPGGAIRIQSARGQGAFSNDASLLIDGRMPAEGADWMDPACVNWSGEGVSFILDLGREYTITGVFAQVDNNDNYVFEASANGTSWMPLATIPENLGTVGLGMENFSAEPASPDYVAGIVVRSQRARYVRVTGQGGDTAYSISEVQVFGR